MPALRKQRLFFWRIRSGGSLHGRRKVWIDIKSKRGQVERSAGIKDRSQSMLKGIVSVISSLAVVANLVS